jgi:hypothetical protein
MYGIVNWENWPGSGYEEDPEGCIGKGAPPSPVCYVWVNYECMQGTYYYNCYSSC